MYLRCDCSLRYWLSILSISTARASIQNTAFEGTHLAIWHGLNAPPLMSVIALLGGLVFYFALAKGGKLRRIDFDPSSADCKVKSCSTYF